MMKYITDQELHAFHSIDGLCKLFDVDKKWIRYVCEKHNMEPECVDGVYGFSKHRAYSIQIYLRANYTIFYDPNMFSEEWSPIWD